MSAAARAGYAGCARATVARMRVPDVGLGADGRVRIAELGVAVRRARQGHMSRRSTDQALQSSEGKAQHRLVGTSAGQVEHHPGLQRDHAGGELD